MKLLVINGSRSAEGQTARAAKSLEAGAIRGGCTVETIYLPREEIACCRQCEDDGWGECRGGQKCVIEDGLAAILEKIREADLCVFATPVYFSDLSESLRALLDRLRRLCIHGAKADRIEGKPALGICVAGGGGGGAPRCCVNLEQILAVCGFDVVDMIPVRRQNLDMKTGVLESVGEWFAGAPRSG